MGLVDYDSSVNMVPVTNDVYCLFQSVIILSHVCLFMSLQLAQVFFWPIFLWHSTRQDETLTLSVHCLTHVESSGDTDGHYNYYC